MMTPEQWEATEAPEGADLDSSSPTFRTMTDRITGAKIEVSGEGNCDTVSVSGDILRYATETSVVEIAYAFDDLCNVTILPGRLIPYEQYKGEAGLHGSGRAVTAVTEESSPSSSGSPAAATVYGNWIHTSQTMQDLLRIDIAKFQYHTHRKWDGSSTWWGGDWWARSSTSVPWNHTSGKPVRLYVGGRGSATYTEAYGAFHSDFLWCNFQPGQNFRLTNRNTSYKDGRYAGHFYQTRACSGTVMATRVWANTDRNDTTP